ncbi:MAG TPA: flagellar basal body-associated FliL family protein [Albitalea sp.]|nr:flagellar basal body-associated FliL family protein [Albitalea sp.]
MSAAAAEPVEHDGEAPELPGKGKKKLVILIAVLALVVGAGAGAVVLVKKRQAAAEAAAAAADADGNPAAAGHAAAAAQKEKQHHGPPAFLPLDQFIVNLADRDTERYAQVGITLELDDPKYADQIKAYMPAIRNGILMVLASKESRELLTRAGKEKLASEVMREAVRPLGIELEDEGDDTAANGGKSGKTPLEESPVRHVHFSSFIIQ